VIEEAYSNAPRASEVQRGGDSAHHGR